MEITPITHQRPTWDEYFMDINRTVGTRGSCDRGRAGAVVVRNNQILVTGYAGSPKGLPHCDEVGHQMKTLTHEDGHQTQHCTRTAHAEQNVIVQAAKTGVSIEGGTLYCKMTPCAVCAKMIINAGIVRVVCEKKYHAGKETEENFEQVGIKLEFLNEETEQYANQ
jgi:dCMP deaminase